MTLHTRLLTLALAGTALAAAVRHSHITVLRAQSVDPCSAAIGNPLTSAATSTRPPKSGPLDHDDRWRHLDSLWAHRAAIAQRRLAPLSTNTRTAIDVDEIAVLQDTGDLVTKANPLDLHNVALRLTHGPSGGYDISRIAYGFRTALGTRITLGDDDTREMNLPFAFTFFGQQYDQIHINSDGNLTFQQGDAASTERSVSRFLTGAPRVSPFFADLDPSTSGSVLTYSDSSVFSVTWCAVRAYRAVRRPPRCR